MRNRVIGWVRHLWPALLVLLLSVCLSLFLGEFAFLRSHNAVYRGILRFLRIALVLCLPLYALVPIHRFIVQRMKRHMIRVADYPFPEFSQLRLWVSRPLQGIGISLLFQTKLIAVLQIVAGSTAADSLIPGRGFNIQLFLFMTGITVLVSLLLSSIWTLDDMAIRYYNEKEREVKMVGKFVGTVMPIVFGILGIRGLLSAFPTEEAINHLLKIFVILYPPFMVFSVLHYYSVVKKYEVLEAAGGLRRKVIEEGGKRPQMTDRA
jgi:hypothetical protein